MTSAHWLFLIAYFGVLAWSGYKPHDYFTWFLEVMPALIGLAIVAALWNRFRFTTLVYGLLTLHCIVLMVGGKYTYAEMPLFNWLRDEFGLARNYYDRLGHFMQGFVPAIIAREVLTRLNVIARPRWLNPIILAIVLAFSAFYEFVEWWVALATGESATAFLGTQGDQWDTQWDMFMCMIGTCLLLLLLSRVHDDALTMLGPIDLPDQSELPTVHQAFALVRNFRSPVEHVILGDFTISKIGPRDIDRAQKIFRSTDVFQGDWVLKKEYAQLPAGPSHAPPGVGGIPNEIEDLLFLLRLYKVGDISIARQCVHTPSGEILIQSSYRVMNDGNTNSIFTSDFSPEECVPFIEFAQGLRASPSWSASWFAIARRFFLYGGAKEYSPKWDEVDRIVDYTISMEAMLSYQTDFLTRRISERAANLLAIEHDEDAKLVAQTIKKIYGVRSTIAHGTPLSAKERVWLLDNLVGVEDMVRRVLVAGVQKIPAEEQARRVFLADLFDVTDDDQGKAAFEAFKKIKTDAVKQSVLADLTEEARKGSASNE